MKLLFSVLLSFLMLISYSQSKYERKAEKLYEKGKYEKCIKKTKKYLKRERKSPELQYYVVASYFKLAQLSQDKRKQSYLRKTILAWERLNKYNKEAIDYSLLKMSIIQSLNEFALGHEIIDSRKANFYHNKLAEVFYDTTQQYKTMHPKLFLAHMEDVLINVTKPKRIFENLSDERIKILQTAEKAIGVRYKYAGVDTTGFDCSGFTQYVYKSAGIEIPHNANKQSKFGDTITLNEAQPGDLIFFGSNSRANHAGLIYANDNGEIELVHCASRGVTHDNSTDLNTKYWLERVLCVQRIVDEKD